MLTLNEETVKIQAVDVALEINIEDLQNEINSVIQSSCKHSINGSFLTIECHDNKYVVIFSYGSMVAFNLTEDEYAGTLMQVKKYATSNNREIHHIDYKLTTGHKAIRVFKDELQVEQLTPEIVSTIAIVLARAVSLKYYEYSLKSSLKEMGNACNELSARKQPHPKLEELHQIVGQAHAVRLELLSDIEVWEEPDLVAVDKI